MSFAPEQLNRIFARTNGRCHICHGQNGGPLVFGRYGQVGAKGAWEVEHSVPKADGGTDHGNNLYAAHVWCNRAKGDGSTRAARAEYGVTRAPRSTAKVKEARERNTLVGLGGGIALGAALGGFLGAALVGVLGAVFGSEVAVD